MGVVAAGVLSSCVPRIPRPVRVSVAVAVSGQEAPPLLPDPEPACHPDELPCAFGSTCVIAPWASVGRCVSW